MVTCCPSLFPSNPLVYIWSLKFPELMCHSYSWTSGHIQAMVEALSLHFVQWWCAYLEVGWCPLAGSLLALWHQLRLPVQCNVMCFQCSSSPRAPSKGEQGNSSSVAFLYSQILYSIWGTFVYIKIEYVVDLSSSFWLMSEYQTARILQSKT